MKMFKYVHLNIKMDIFQLNITIIYITKYNNKLE